ncbi:MAG: hypothetical protein WEC58_03150, partial [Candidatus Paceibacterota bacterium]
MEDAHLKKPEQPFRSLSEEREHLRREVAERERSYAEAGKDTDEAANDVVRENRAESAVGVV